MKRIILSRFLITSLLCGCAVVACAVLGEQWVSAADVDYFTDNGLDNAVASIQHPSAEQFNGNTYIAY